MPHDPTSARASPLTSPTLRLAAAGFIATAIAFGPARVGFGLFLPAFRETFTLSTTLAGFIASGGFLAFLLALPLTAWLDNRVGPRVPVVAGLLAAAAGFAVVASASSATALAIGIALAGASAGFCWSPFNDAVERVVAGRSRPGVLSEVATGTTLGVAAAGALALAFVLGALDWRAAWIAFAGAALVAALVAFAGVPRGRRRESGEKPPAFRPFRRAVLPLYVTAFLFGATNAIYLSFAADRVVAAGGLPGLPQQSASAVVFLCYGILGAAGLITGRIESRLGLAPLVAMIFAAFALSLALIAIAPGSWPGIVTSAGLHGAAVMMLSAVLSLWSLRHFPGHGSFGLTAALVAAAIGNVIGPALSGPLVESAGPQTAFLILAAPPLALALAFAARPRLARVDRSS